VQDLWGAVAEVLEERSKRRQPLVAGLHVPQEREHPVEAEILELQAADGSMRVGRDKGQEQPQGVAVTANRALAQALLLDQMIKKKVVHERAERGGTHGCTPG
jgi:hypothetical protein